MELKKKILIVDDEPINLEFFEVMLSKLGFEVEKAVNGTEALDKVVDTNPDLIVLDNIMPKLSGWDVTKKLKNDPEYAKYKGIPIIMFSAMDSVKDKIEGLEMGVADYITKPFNFGEVFARIKAVLRNQEIIEQINRRDKRIALIESLNNALIVFTEHIRKPISELLESVKTVDVASKDDVKNLISLVNKEGHEIMSTLKGLEDEIEELQNKKSKLKQGDLTIEDLENKFRKHFKEMEESRLK